MPGPLDKKLLGAPGLTTSNKKLLGAHTQTTRRPSGRNTAQEEQPGH